MAVGTRRAHAGAVGVMDGGLQFDEDVVAHFVAAGAEGFGVGQLKRGVETAPKNNARHEAADGQESERKNLARCR